MCSYGVCFNGGHCREGSTQLCDCLAGFNGPSCQYVLLPGSPRASLFDISAVIHCPHLLFHTLRSASIVLHCE
ncbi:hypothetical protein NQZ68_010682 [Dissostichus eleginoides]|nr:hypothetical protein NQZ68_010682 [Dissostichus eleginoides]